MHRAIHIKTGVRGYITDYKPVDKMKEEVGYSFVSDSGIKIKLLPYEVLILIEGGLSDE